MKDERTELSNGYRWWRHVLYLPILFFLMGVISFNSNVLWMVAGLCVSIGLYILLLRSRRLRFDDLNLYVIHGQVERAIHYTAIESIKKSRAKVNGRRFWIVTYDDGSWRKRKLRYFPWDFGGVSTQFNNAVRQVNPKVVIWEHPFFNH